MTFIQCLKIFKLISNFLCPFWFHIFWFAKLPRSSTKIFKSTVNTRGHIEYKYKIHVNTNREIHSSPLVRDAKLLHVRRLVSLHSLGKQVELLRCRYCQACLPRSMPRGPPVAHEIHRTWNFQSKKKRCSSIQC